ncbi:hypothetical protein BLNAU_17974 [Blattamonas nauphoetae]|uniref:Uncharacterized protein n=1 Tax=Blattamonas nauphoetae TaxID=2049346 RepID=A0ABQ9X5Y6_9EUKA|nr:hypothetical protein BLNAU_17974 [Blattamonas nauphoetae]
MIEIVDSVMIRDGIRIVGGMHAVIRNGASSEPSLIIPSSFSLDSLSVVIVVEATRFLEIRNVNVSIGSSVPSLVFLSATQATILLRDEPITGSKSSLARNVEESEDCFTPGYAVFGLFPEGFERKRRMKTCVIQKSSIERRSESVLANMKWWLPLVIVVAVVLLTVIGIVVSNRGRSLARMGSHSRQVWLFSDFLVILRHHSMETSRKNDLNFLNRPCFSAALKEITNRCQNILSQLNLPPSASTSLDERGKPNSQVFTQESHLSTSLYNESSLHSTQNNPPLSFGSNSEQSFESEDTHLSTQMPPPPSLDSIDLDDQNTDSAISPSDRRRQACLQLLELIHDIRSKRTDTGETDWDPTAVFENPQTDSTVERPRERFDDTIFDSMNLVFIYGCLKECNEIFEQTGNWHHLALTPLNVTKLTHTLLSDDPVLSDLAHIHLFHLLKTVPDQSMIVSTVFPIMRRSQREMNDQATHVWISILAYSIDLLLWDSLSHDWTDTDWIAVFSHKWMSQIHLPLAVAGLIHVLERFQENPPFSFQRSSSLVGSFNKSNNFVNGLVHRIKFDPHYFDSDKTPSLFSAVLLCCAAEDKPIPRCIVNKVSEFVGSMEFEFSEFMLSFSPYIKILQCKPRFASTLPLPLLCERLVREVLTGKDETLIQCLPQLFVCSDSATFIGFLHPFILRGFGSVLLRHADTEFQSVVPRIFLFRLTNVADWECFLATLSVYQLVPSSQIVETANAILQLYLAGNFTPHSLVSILSFVSMLSEYLINTASLQSVVRLYRLLTRIKSTSSTDHRIELINELWTLTMACLDKFRSSLPLTFFDACFRTLENECHTHLHSTSPHEPEQLPTRELNSMNSFARIVNREGVNKAVLDAIIVPMLPHILDSSLSPVSAFRNLSLPMLSKIFVPANAERVLDWCRLGVVECVMKAIETSSSLDEYEMGRRMDRIHNDRRNFNLQLDHLFHFDTSVANLGIDLFEKYRER